MPGDDLHEHPVLARQGVALRGHENEDGNFRQLLLLRSNDLPMIKQWLQRKSASVSPQAQNEILQLFANAIVRSIAEEVRKAEHFSVIVDGTTAGYQRQRATVDLPPVH